MEELSCLIQNEEKVVSLPNMKYSFVDLRSVRGRERLSVIEAITYEICNKHPCCNYLYIEQSKFMT